MNRVGETYGFTSVNFLYVLVSKSPDGQEINLMVVEVKEEKCDEIDLNYGDVL